MAIDNNLYSGAQLKMLLELQKILDQLKNEKVHIAGICAYEVHTVRDAGGKPYVSLT